MKLGNCCTLVMSGKAPLPCAIREGLVVAPQFKAEMQALPIGKGRVVRTGKHIAYLCFGTILHEALKAAEEINATVVDMRFVKPLDEALIKELAEKHDLLITVEENALMGGAGSAVLEVLNQEGLHIPVRRCGIPDHFVPHGKQTELRQHCKLDWRSLKDVAISGVKKLGPSHPVLRPVRT